MYKRKLHKGKQEDCIHCQQQQFAAVRQVRHEQQVLYKPYQNSARTGRETVRR